jgi:hypothetical protein
MRRTTAALLLIAGLVAACGQVSVSGRPSGGEASPSGGSVSASASPDADLAAAKAYCTEKGGMLVDRVATWNTNADPQAWLPLAGRMTLCEFQSTEDGNTTRISVDLVTLSSEQPTLASLAYLSDVRTTQPPQVGQNPAQWSCINDFWGAAAFGTAGAAGGGWVAADEPVFTIMSLCVFPDDSAIDEFGLWYHANDAIRGADLAPIFRYQPDGPLPAVFAPQGR